MRTAVVDISLAANIRMDNRDLVGGDLQDLGNCPKNCDADPCTSEVEVGV